MDISSAPETPRPSPSILAGANAVVSRLGGRCHPNAVHADRISAPEGHQKLGLTGCDHRGVLVDLPLEDQGILGYDTEAAPPPTSGPTRLCLICDAVPRMPRVLRAAVEGAREKDEL